MAEPLPAIPIEYLHKIFSYNPNTGILTRKSTGRPVGCPDRFGYLRVGINRKIYFVHRVVWALVTGNFPGNTIDHINRKPDDNRFCNLREATQQENLRNYSMRSDNRSGFKGVSWRSDRQKWTARGSSTDGRYISLGTFESPETAHAAYQNFVKIQHGDFYCHPEADHSISSGFS